MELLFVSDFDFNPDSGAAGSLTSIGRSLQALGHNVDYIWRDENQQVSSNNLFRFLELPKIQYKQVEAALAKKKYHAVIISQPHSWLAVKKLKPKYPDVLFLNRTHGWELRIAPVTWQLTHSNGGGIRKLKNGLTYLLLKHCSFLTVKYSDGIICAGSDDADFIRKSYPRFGAKVFVNSYGLDSTFLNLHFKKSEGSQTSFLYAGQYLVRKGIYDLIKVFEKLKDRAAQFKLTFIVNSNAVDQVKKDYSFLPDGCLDVKSWVNRQELLKIYSEQDVFLMPSYGEGFGKTTIEGMACGMCVLGYREGALTDFGVQKENALICDTGDLKGLYENLDYALTNPDHTRKMGLSAFKSIQGQTWEKHAADTISIIENITKLKGRK